MEKELYTYTQIRVLYDDKISQVAFAEQVGINPLRWQRIERYETMITGEELVKLHKKTKCDVTKIVFKEEK